MSRSAHDPYEQLLNDMLRRTLDGEIIPFDEWLDAMDELSEEPDDIPTEEEIQHAQEGQAWFAQQMRTFGLPTARYALTQALDSLSESQN